MDFVLGCSLGALIIASGIVIAALVINAIRIDNEILRKQEERKRGPWTWD